VCVGGVVGEALVEHRWSVGGVLVEHWWSIGERRGASVERQWTVGGRLIEGRWKVGVVGPDNSTDQPTNKRVWFCLYHPHVHLGDC